MSNPSSAAEICRRPTLSGNRRRQEDGLAGRDLKGGSEVTPPSPLSPVRLRLYDIDTGRILIDGPNVRYFGHRRVRSRTATTYQTVLVVTHGRDLAIAGAPRTLALLSRISCPRAVAGQSGWLSYAGDYPAPIRIPVGAARRSAVERVCLPECIWADSERGDEGLPQALC